MKILRIGSIFIAFLVVLSAISVAAVTLETEKIKDISVASDQDIKDWTWLFYDDADFYSAFDPLVGYTGIPSFASEACSSENLDIIVLQDKEHGPARLWYIDEQHNKILLEELGEINMGDPATLSYLILYGKDNFPAERYFLSLYNHGGGWRGACWDDTDDDHLTMDEINQALSDGQKVDIIAFTAPCLMGAIESVYELKDVVDVYIGSEELSGYLLWAEIISDICDIFTDTPYLSNIEVGEQIIQLIDGIMSAIRTDKMPELAESINMLISDIFEYIDDYSMIDDARDNTKYFASSSHDRYQIFDLYNFTQEYSLLLDPPLKISCDTDEGIETVYFDDEIGDTGSKDIDPTNYLLNDLQNIRDCINNVVIANQGYDKGAHGLSIYFPTGQNYSSLYEISQLDFLSDTLWDEFIDIYAFTATVTIDGPIECVEGIEYTYSAVATHPYGYHMQYGWDWNGDFIVDEWGDSYGESGCPVKTNHIWTESGEHEIHAKAISFGIESGWSEKMTIKVFKRGDMNGDGWVTFQDTNPFIMALSNPDLYQDMYDTPELIGDINLDGFFNFGDINPFIDLLYN